MAKVRITERVERPFAGARVDADAGVIYGASICGPSSKNGNDYDRESFGDGSQYEGRHVYLNHTKDRLAENKIGWFENARIRSTGMPEGDFHVLKSHPMAGAILEAAQRNPNLFGFSHSAVCRTSRGQGGRTKVESVETVESIDLVAEPATTRGIFEGVMSQTTLRQILEGAESQLDGDKRKRVRRLLVEADDGMMADVMDAPLDAPGDDLTGDTAIDGGIRALTLAILDDASLSTDEKLKKLRLVLQTGDKLNGTESKPAETPAETPAEESVLKSEHDRLIRESAAKDVEILALRKGVTLTEEQREALTLLADDAKRTKLLESFRAVTPPAEKPHAAGRMSAASLLGQTKVEESVTEPSLVDGPLGWSLN